jgi:hypothetical protein
MFTFAPKAFMPFICRSTGLTPIIHPPGKETLALFILPKRGPNTQKEARIVETNLYSAVKLLIFFASMVTSPLENSACAPRERRILIIVFTSRRLGTFLIRQRSEVKRQAAKIGRAEFFAPLTVTVPFKGTAPSIMSLSIFFSL